MAAVCGLIEGIASAQVIAVRAFDADRLHDVILDQCGELVIPPRRHRKYQHSYGTMAYKNRWGSGPSSQRSSSGDASQRGKTKSPPTSSASKRLAPIMLWLKRSNCHYSLDLRLDLAERLLVGGRMTIADIVHLAGF